MARYDVYINEGQHSDSTPYLLDVQSNLLDALESCVVIPLRNLEPYKKTKIPTRLMPVLKIKGKEYLLETPKMAAVPKRILKKQVTSLANEQDHIVAAIDFLFQGY
jgi:toxin CcdB